MTKQKLFRLSLKVYCYLHLPVESFSLLFAVTFETSGMESTVWMPTNLS